MNSGGASSGEGNASSADEQLTFTTLTSSSSSTATNSAVAASQQQPEFAAFMADHRHDSTENDDQDGMGSDHGGNDGELREQDRFLPIANVARIMKKSIPSAQGKIAKDARECVQECVSEFISFITSEASDRCQAEKRKTINGEDILFAMSTLGFDNYVEPLKLYLQKYREAMKGEKRETDTDLESINELLDSNLATMGADQAGSQVLLSYGGSQQFGSIS